MPTPKPKSSSDSTSTEPSSSKSSSPVFEKPSSPSSSDESTSSTESQAPLAERERLPDWLLEDRHATSERTDEETGSETSSKRSPEPSPESTNVWKPWSGEELTVPPELVPLFIRTQVDLAIQIVQGEMEQMQDLLNATPPSEWLLRHTLTSQQNQLETTRLTLLGILFRNQEEEKSPNLFVPDPTLIGANGRPL